MTRIEKVVKEMSDLRDFYLKIKKRKKPGPSAYSQKPPNPESSPTLVKEEQTSPKDTRSYPKT